MAHSITVTWTASPDSTADNPGTVVIYRATGNLPVPNPAPGAFSVVANNQPPAGSWTDASVHPGAYTYMAEAIVGGVVSDPSMVAAVMVLPRPPATIKAVIDV